MAYQGAEAIYLRGAQAQPARPERQAAPSFEVLEGGGLDARARRGVDAIFVGRVRLCLIAVAVVVLIGSVRVALSAATVSILQEGSALREQVVDLQDTNAELEIERSVASSSERVVAIATQAYGMVHASNVETIDVTPAEELAEGEAAESGASEAQAEVDTSTNSESDAEAASEAGI